MKIIKRKIHKKLENIIDHMFLLEDDSYNIFKTLPIPSLMFTFHYKDIPYEKSYKHFKITQSSSVDGYNNIPIDYISKEDIGVIIIAFKPWAKSILKELNGEFNISENLDLNDIFSSVTQIEERLKNENSDEKKFEIIEQFLISLIEDKEINIYVKEAIKYIYVKKGNIISSELSTNLGYSQKQIERLFKTHIGSSPKKFARIVQFQNSLNLLKNTNLSFSEIAQSAGYFDQSHFIKSFKTYTNISPEKFTRIIPSDLNVDLNTFDLSSNSAFNYYL